MVSFVVSDKRLTSLQEGVVFRLWRCLPGPAEGIACLKASHHWLQTPLWWTSEAPGAWGRSDGERRSCPRRGGRSAAAAANDLDAISASESQITRSTVHRVRYQAARDTWCSLPAFHNVNVGPFT